MDKKMLWISVLVVFVLAPALACGDKEAEEGEAAEETNADVGVVEMETFLTNINSPSGKHYAKLQLKLAVSPEENASAIQADAVMMARLRDQVLTLLTTKTHSDLAGPEGKENFRNQVRERLTPLLKGSELKEVLFAEFVVQ